MTEKNTFEKVQRTDKPMYGPAGLLLCGFSAAAQSKFRTVLKMAAMDSLPLIWANASHQDRTLAELLACGEGCGAGEDSTLSRAVIVSGITENQLHALMTICRKSGMQQSLWAALTPTSETWRLGRLLDELQAERRALARRRKK